MRYRIVLIHAVPMAIDPIVDAFNQFWPEPELVNLLDDSLSTDRAKSTKLDNNMISRFHMLGDYAKSIQANGILFSCSAFGPAIDEISSALSIPVLKPNEAMFELALETGQTIAMLATFKNSIPSMTKEFNTMSQNYGGKQTLNSYLIEEAMEKLKQGDAEGHNKLLATAAKAIADCDSVMLAQFSMAQAKASVEAKLNVPVLTAPEAAAKKLQRLVMQ